MFIQSKYPRDNVGFAIANKKFNSFKFLYHIDYIMKILDWEKKIHNGIRDEDLNDFCDFVNPLKK